MQMSPSAGRPRFACSSSGLTPRSKDSQESKKRVVVVVRVAVKQGWPGPPGMRKACQASLEEREWTTRCLPQVPVVGASAGLSPAFQSDKWRCWPGAAGMRLDLFQCARVHIESYRRKEVITMAKKSTSSKSKGLGHPGKSKGLGKLPSSGVAKSSKNLFKH
jgi:hypothetical protein